MAEPIRKESPPPNEEKDEEMAEWCEALHAVINVEGKHRAKEILEKILEVAKSRQVPVPIEQLQTPYVNTISKDEEPAYPGNLEIERRIRNLVRWNAMAMVVRANQEESGIGGHISTFASCAVLYEVGFNHFFRGRQHPCGGDHIYFQGHASPGNYARSFLEGRLSEDQLRNFRREIRSPLALSSYPHPWLMPDYWEFPTVSMGLGPIQAIYRARFMRYLENRDLVKASGAKVWAFVGDGECDEPESLGALTLASRERLDNLVFVVNCNLQRLDGPVRGNGKIIQELESVFRGAGWNVIKVIWGSEWDKLFEKDTEGKLVKRLGEILDGEYQKYRVESGAYVRERLFGTDPALKDMVKDYSDEALAKMRLGGHDPVKVHAAYRAAVDYPGGPSVILAKTIKGYGLGEAGEGRNVTHQQKKFNREELVRFRDRFKVPIPDERLTETPFVRFEEGSPEANYLRERREALGGFIPERVTHHIEVKAPADKLFEEFFSANGHKIATTMVVVRLLSKLLRDENIGKLIVPIVPDEARTFGMDSLFRQCGIYSSVGQLYEPVDAATLLFYKEAKDGQLLEEGITEAGSMCSFIAAGTSYAMHQVPMLPFFFFYSMFGFQRVGDLIWSAADSRARGFLIGATSGRTTLSGEGLQHQDGHSHLIAETIPNVQAYDPAFIYEIAIIVREGIRRMFVEGQDVIYYITVGNEPYTHPTMPEGVEEDILKGIYRLRKAGPKNSISQVQLLGSGAILNEVLSAQDILKERYGLMTDLWSVTSYKRLREEALEVERWNRLHPAEKPRVPFLSRCFAGIKDPIFVAASDYMKLLPDSIAKWLPGSLVTLGTDGFGRSDSRAFLREYFEVNAKHIVLGVLSSLVRLGKLSPETIIPAFKELGIDAESKATQSVGTDAGGEGGTSGAWGGGATQGTEAPGPPAPSTTAPKENGAIKKSA